MSMTVRDLISSSTNTAVTNFSSAIIDKINKTIDVTKEGSLDLEYGMTLTYPQPVALLQVGDLFER
jgi:hypothetical protein